MKITQKDIEALKKFKPTMDAFTAVNALIDDEATLSSFQNAHTEAEARLNDKRIEETKIDERLAATKDTEDKTKEAYKAALDAKDEVLSVANLEAVKIKKEANTTGDGIIDRAKAQALSIRNNASQELIAIQTEVETARAEFTQIADACDDKKKELDNLNAQLDAAKEHIAKLLKG